MTALTYSLLFFGAICVGVCLGFFLAALLSFGSRDNDKEVIGQQADSIDALVKENDKLKQEIATLVSKLWEIEAIIGKHFGPVEKER